MEFRFKSYPVQKEAVPPLTVGSEQGIPSGLGQEMELFFVPLKDIFLKPLMHLKDSAQNNTISGPSPEESPVHTCFR